MTPSTWISRALLLAFPKAFRDRLGRQLVQTLLTDSRAPSGRLRPVRFAVGAADVVRAGLAERMAVRRRARGDQHRGRSWLDAWWQDVRQGARRLAGARGFTFVAVLTLALGVGVNSALFQLLDAVRLRPLPVSSPEELVEIRIRNAEGARGNFSIWHAGATNAIWEQVRARQNAFSSVFAWTGSGVRLTADGIEPRFANALLVSGESFAALGLTPALGRLLTADDDTRGCTTPGVVLSHAFWHTEFGADPAIVGRGIVLGRDTYHVAGVAPRDFTGLEVGRRFDVALPLCAEWLPPGSFSRLDSGVEWFLIVMGRLKPGWTLEQARAHLASISPAVFEASLPPNYPADGVARYLGFQLTALDASRGISLVREQYSEALWFLQATALLVLLVGCANLANLMLARVATREREIAARLALGASRGQIFRLLLVESVLLSVTGTVAGALVARPMSVVLIKFIDGGTDSLFLSLAPDWRLLAFGSLAGALTCILSGVTPAWRAGGISPGAVVRTGGRALTDSRGGTGLRRGLVIAQVGLSFVLLFGALLFTRSLARVALQDLGLQPDGLTIAYVDMSGAKVPVARRAEFKRMLLRELTSTPGVVSAAETSVVPLSGGASDNDVWLDGARDGRALSFFVDIGGTYFDTAGMSLVSGRTFDDAVDVPGSPAAVVVNEAFARAFARGGNPVGRRLWREAGADRPEKELRHRRPRHRREVPASASGFQADGLRRRVAGSAPVHIRSAPDSHDAPGSCRHRGARPPSGAPARASCRRSSHIPT